MRAILINPWDKTILNIDEPNMGLFEMYALLSGPPEYRKCEDINSVRLTQNDFLWVDGEGLLIPNVPIWRLGEYSQPLAGMGLVLGATIEGDNCSCTVTADWISPLVKWTTLVTTGDLGPTTQPAPNIIKLGDPVLKEKEDD